MPIPSTGHSFLGQEWFIYLFLHIIVISNDNWKYNNTISFLTRSKDMKFKLMGWEWDSQLSIGMNVYAPV